MIMIFLIFFSAVLLSACTKTATLEQARQLAADAVLKTDAYTQNDAYNFTETSETNITKDSTNQPCTGCYDFEFSFWISSTRGYSATVSVVNNNVTKLELVPVQQLVVCSDYTPNECPDGCIVCPPCPECSSIKCQDASVCTALGFDKEWYNFTLQEAQGAQCTQPIADNSMRDIPIQDRFKSDVTCKNNCGNGVCDDNPCQDPGCSCQENAEICPEDCG